ncbi:MAG: hypothetical protein JW901_11590 [Dehalococcoidia bacterium]|nr:hypothetical protein [Dehalococcoidia bacterium]
MKGYVAHRRFVYFAILLLLIVAAVAGAFSGCVRGSQSSTFKTYQDSIHGYSFFYPAGWKQVDPALLQAGEYIAFWDPDKGNGMPPYVSISEIPLVERMTLADYFKSEMTMVNRDESYTFISSEDIVINGIPAKKHVALFDHETTPAKVMQGIMVYGNSGWIVNCMCSPSKYNTYKPTFDSILNSFRIMGSSAAAAPATPAATGSSPSAAWVTHRDTVNGYSISVPGDWDALPESDWSDNTIYGLQSLDYAKHKAVIFVVNKYTQTSSLPLQSEYKSVQSQFAQLSGYQFISDEQITVAGIPSIKYICQVTDDGVSEIIVMVIFIQDDKVWWIPMICAPSSEFSSNELIYNKIIDSFQLISPLPATAGTGILDQTTPSTSPTSQAAYSFSTYADSENGFSVRYPSDWLQASPGQLSGHEVVRFEGSQGSFNVSIRGKADDVTLEQCCREVETEMSAWDGYRLISKTPVTISGLDAKRYVFDMLSSGTQIRMMMVMLTRGDSIWLVVSGAPPSLFSSYEDTFNTIAESLSIFGAVPSSAGITTQPSSQTSQQQPIQPATQTSGTESSTYQADWVKMDIPVKTVKINAIWGNAYNNVFAVGSYSPDEGRTWKSLVMRYNGINWYQMACPGDKQLHAVWGSGSSCVYAVGDDLHIVRYNGQAWEKMPRPDVWQDHELYGVWGTSPKDVYACGSQWIILHYDGDKWSIHKDYSGGGDFNRCLAVWGTGPDNIYAGGTGMLHFDGKSWEHVALPFRVDTVNNIWGTSDSDVYVTFIHKDEDCTSAHYDGKQWARSIFDGKSGFNYIEGTSGNNILVAGAAECVCGNYSESCNTVFGNRVLRYDGYQRKCLKSPTRQLGGNELVNIVKVWGSGWNDWFGVSSENEIYHYDGR